MNFDRAKSIDLLHNVKSIRNTAGLDAALNVVEIAMRGPALSTDMIGRLGRYLLPEVNSAAIEGGLSVLVLGQCTTEWLASSLCVQGIEQGLRLSVTCGEYDNVRQEIEKLKANAIRPDYVVLLPWTKRLLATESPLTASERVEEELTYWKHVWSVLFSNRIGIIQIGYDFISPGTYGTFMSGKKDGVQSTVYKCNAELRDALPDGSYFVDLPILSSAIGKRHFYDNRQYYWTKQPFSSDGLASLSRQVAVGIRTIRSGPKKVLVVDLDNTVWGGVVGEVGPYGIAVAENADGEAFHAFQMRLKELTGRGVLLAACSKNNESDAREPFEKNPDMVLRFGDFAAFKASWEPKAIAIRSIADNLNLGLESFVFFDDNPAEREHIRQALPEVAVIEVPEEPAEYINALDNSMWFETISVTMEDLARSHQYQTAIESHHLRESMASIEDYLSSLDMQADVRTIGETDLPRIVQLFTKTNQFNLTTRRHQLPDLCILLKHPRAIGLSLRIRDRFGDHGLVSALIAIPSDTNTDALCIDSWLMSCRVIGRTVEEFLFNHLCAAAIEKGYSHLFGQYLATKKNGLVADLLPRLGFCPVNSGEEDGTFSLHLNAALQAITFVKTAAE